MSKHNILMSVAAVGLACVSMAGMAMAAPQSAPQAATSDTIRLWTGKAPGTWPVSGPEAQREYPRPGEPPIVVTANVSEPTMTVYRPAKGKANGAAMVILPGGGFMILAMQHEGRDIARWATDHGITAFVVKYRVRDLQIPYDEYVKNPAPYDNPFDKFLEFVEPSLTIASTDAQQAVRLVRRNAKSYGIDPQRIGMIGFSAGAITTVRVVETADDEGRPNFAASIYGASLKPPKVPAGFPLFLAHAQDDPAVPAQKSVDLYQTWKKATAPVELHIFGDGGHGFGLGKPTSLSHSWPSLFETWLQSRKVLPMDAK